MRLSTKIILLCGVVLAFVITIFAPESYTDWGRRIDLPRLLVRYFLVGFGVIGVLLCLRIDWRRVANT
jgi:hypothetical protein